MHAHTHNSRFIYTDRHCYFTADLLLQIYVFTALYFKILQKAIIRLIRKLTNTQQPNNMRGW